MDVDLEHGELSAMRLQWSALPDGRVHRVGPLEVFAAAGPPWLRQVCLAQGPVETEELDEALAQVPGALVQAVDGELTAAVLEQRGYRPATPLLRLVAPAAARRPLLRVELVGPEAAAVVAELARQGTGLDLPRWWTGPLGRPGWVQAVAYDGDLPVATAGLHVSGDLGHIGGASTVPAARGRGAQTALLAARLTAAAERGARRVAVKVEPGSRSHRNLLRAGFAPAHSLTQWVRA